LLQGEFVLKPQQAVVLEQLDKTAVVQRVFCETVQVACFPVKIQGPAPGGQGSWPFLKSKQSLKNNFSTCKTNQPLYRFN